MIVVQITKELVAQAFTTGNEIHIRIKDGIPEKCELIGVGLTRDGTLQLKFNTEEYQPRGTLVEKAVTVEALPCRLATHPPSQNKTL